MEYIGDEINVGSTLQHAYGILGNRIATTLPDGHVHQINLDGDVIADIERDRLHREKSRTQGALISRYQRDTLGRLLGSAACTARHDLDPWAGEGKHSEPRKGFVLLPRRWVVERSFGWAARFRRLARDYERMSETLAGLHFVAFVCLMLPHMARMIHISS